MSGFENWPAPILRRWLLSAAAGPVIFLIGLAGRIALHDPTLLTLSTLWFLAAGGDGHRLIFGGCDEVGAYMELTLWHNTAHAESFQFYLSDYPCPGYAE